ncbi:RebB family R body protein [Vibrio coralliilyticus]|uniref:RebB family R body protein n=1 Tax=Vibrio coralliilyticus TaxID=190893 RepID=UPI00148E18D8|nr:RebB family R body protein [Vibrio coralliilyticus]NOI27093.1 hypothetical protein [Vibrio coralliilyticus]NOI46616.1 hypothetical protein [Vibrio coralliilyticus]
MKEQDTRFENEFEQELSQNAIDQFNTLQAFSSQPTSLLETTLADTLGLSMHNAVSTQQQSQMTTAASVTNACARLLQTQTRPTVEVKVEPKTEPAIFVDASHRLGREDGGSEDIQEEAEEKKRSFSLLRFLKRNKGANDDQQ